MKDINQLKTTDMKRQIYIFIALAVIAVTTVSCGSDDDADNTYNLVSTPEKDAQGTYSGIYYRIQTSTTDTTKAEGTLIITPTDSAYVADIDFECPTFTVSAVVASNISHANGGFVFSNHLKKNVINSTVIGRIDEEKNIESHFSVSQRSGRRTVTYNFIFIGKKQ